MIAPEVLQAYGLGPPPVTPPPVDPADPNAPPDQPAPDLGGLHPLVAQAYGLLPPRPVAPPVPTPPTPPAPGTGATPADQQAVPAPTTLPSIADRQAEHPQPTEPPQQPDYKVPAPDVAPQPAKPAAKPAPTQPMNATQLESAAQGKQNAADAQSARAIATQEGVTKAQAAEDLAAFNAHADAAKQIEDQRKALADDLTKTRATKQLYVDNTMKAVDDYKVDQNKYWNEAGVGTHVGWYIAMALQGLGNAIAGRGGEPNAVIQMLQQKMHQSVVAQMDERDALKEKNARAEHALDKFDTFSANRQAQIDLLDARNDRALAGKIALDAAKYKDPQATANAQKMYADLMQSSAEKAQKAADTATTHDIQQKQLAVSQGQLSLENRKFTWEQNKDQQMLDLKAAELAAKKQGKLSDEESKRALFVPGPDGKPVVARNSDGSPVLSTEPAQAAKDRRMIAASEAYNRLVGQMVRGIQDHGGESTWIKGAEWQKMMTDLQSATAELHDAYGITSFREPTVQFFEKMATGGVDPTSFVRDASSALIHSNQNLQSKVNEMLRGNGYDGPTVKWQDTTRPAAPTPTPDDKALSIVLGDRGDAPGRLPGTPVDVDYDPLKNPTRATPEDVRVGKEYPKMASTQRQLLEVWRGMASSDDPATKQRGLGFLEQAARNADEPGVRGYAQELLNSMINPASAPGAPEVTTGASGEGYSRAATPPSPAPTPALDPASFLQQLRSGAPGTAATPMR